MLGDDIQIALIIGPGCSAIAACSRERICARSDLRYALARCTRIRKLVA